mmetsp:Transcript_2090/g.4753  ORF Transcript_2090/g.4753 Transcript_2090/m.4753 type:complete len:226 (-) Transcript_2090:164-841(-)
MQFARVATFLLIAAPVASRRLLGHQRSEALAASATQPGSGAAVALSLAQGTDALLHFLEGQQAISAGAGVENSASNGTNVTAKEKFLDSCLLHVRRLIGSLDRSYTDENLMRVLKHSCQHSENFPSVYEDGFKHSEACNDFAEQLHAARMKELENSTSTLGYSKFCADYYAHLLGGSATPVKVKATPQASYLIWIILALIILVLGLGSMIYFAWPKKTETGDDAA